MDFDIVIEMRYYIFFRRYKIRIGTYYQNMQGRFLGVINSFYYLLNIIHATIWINMCNILSLMKTL